MKNKKGFTLIELLGVIILLAVILTIAVTAYSRYLNSAKNKTFKIAEKNFQTAAKSAYADCFEDSTNNSFCQYHGELDSKYTYQIVYLKELIDNTYIDEIKSPYDTDQMCDSSLSYVYVSNKSAPTANNKDMVYEACLVCGDHKSESCRDDIDLEAPTFGTTCTAYYDAVGGPLYDGNWTDRDVYLVFRATGNYRYGIDEFSYSINDGSSTKIDSNKTTNTATLHLNKTVGNKVYKVQAIDGMNGKGSIVSCGANIKIDKGTISSVDLSAKTVSGKTVTSGTWVSEKVTLSASVNPSDSVSGYLYQWYKDGEKFGSQTSSPNLTVDGIGTYKVEVTNQVGKIKAFSENEFVVKSDPVKPKVELVISDGILSGKWHSSKFTIGYNEKIVNNISGNNYYYGTKSNPTDKWTSLSIDTDSKTSSGTTYYFKICSGVGLCDEVTYVAKLDTSTPEKIGTPVLAATDGIGSGSWHKAKTTLTASDSNSVSGITYYLDTNKNPSTKQSSKEIVDNTTASGTTYYAKACNGAGTCSGISNYVLKIDTVTPPTPSLAVSDNIQSNKWHKAEFTVTASGGNNISGNTYHYGTSVAANSTNSNKAPFSDNTTAVTYYFKICSGAGLCSEIPANYVVKLDKSVPTVTAKNASNYITTTTGASITSYFNITGVISGNTTVCKVGSTTVTNTNNLSLGSNTVTCTSTSGSGLSSSASTVFKHQYVATATCASGYTLSGSTCSRQVFSHYSCPNGGTLSGSKCNTSSTYTGTPTCASGYTLSGSTCSRQVFSHYSCPNGGTLSGSTCDTSSSYTASYACNGGRTLNGDNCEQKYTNDIGKCGCKTTGCTSWKTGSQFDTTDANFNSSCNSACNGKNSCSCDCTSNGTFLLCKPKWCAATGCTAGKDCTLTENEYRYSTCPNGGSLSGTTCTISGSYNATANNKTETVNATYTCPNGGSLSGTTCTISGSYNATANNKTETIGATYVCPSGGSLSGTTCSF